MDILKNLKKNTILLLGITVIVLFFILKDHFRDIVENLENINLWYVLIALIFFLVSVFIKGLTNYMIINDKEKYPIKEAISQNFIMQFFNGITPFATGGEPMAVYMLKEQGFSLARSTNFMVLSFIFYQIALVIFGIIAVTYNAFFALFPEVKLLQHLVLIGFAINIVVVILLLLSYSKRITDKMSQISIKIARKIKLKLTDEEIAQKFEDYHNGLKLVKTKKIIIVIGITLNMISLFCLYMVPFWIIRGIGINNMNVMDTIVSSAYVYLIGAFVPVPGASGGIEYGFTRFFGNFMAGDIVSAVVIVWRFITYFLGIIIGALLFNIRRRGE